ncbi:polyphosphate:AMP phosphotransferase [Oleomonas cavernae]|uniref:Polyphosphate:AMP phosphotransferase n=1 Tax=Oleomonas cavernae TaxID=2320859 RepID=A0A418WBB0_9PROT|nr:polyphosphate:AMP phosphotransferase [Oleomonas cavernae]RJF87264.1 polyphosphate:AMP phosphotransferase [Oleomonas cavernae]
MFESAEIGNRLQREVYDREMPRLRARLIELQGRLLARRKTEVVIVLAGADGAGRSETARVLSEWFDPRHVEVRPDEAPNCEAAARPPMWRYWQGLPAKGKIGIFFTGWYSAAIQARMARREDLVHFDADLESIKRFESMLVEEGALVVKFWFHLARKDQKERLQALESNPETAWRITKADWKRHRHYKRLRNIGERVVRETSTGVGPWFVVEGLDRDYCEVTVAQILVDEISRQFDRQDAEGRAKLKRRATDQPTPTTRVRGTTNVLSALDLKQPLDKDAYRSELAQWQGCLAKLSRSKGFHKRGALAVFEGYDAAGKGGAIRRVAEALDPRFYQIVPIAAPTEEERAHPYLWRFWRHVPAHGRLVMFDRSWYGRVLVERVDGFVPEPVWRRAYAEINEFEQELVDFGIVMAKFMLVVSPREQLHRFKEREKTDFKRYKITPDDWHNREMRPAYDEAVVEMMQRTSTEIAPWTLIEADNKYHARIKVLRTLVETIEQAG